MLFLTAILLSCNTHAEPTEIVVGATQTDKYFPLLEGKTVGLVVNNTSRVNKLHLVDFLVKNEIDVKKIFAPEHGFRGDVSAGGKVEDGVDTQTGLPVFSLYGETRKPTPEHLDGLDAMIFDIQDVGCRFYTYISTLHLVLEACAEYDVPLIVLDRPNPNGDYVAGPVRKEGFESFVSMDPIPIVHGCTVGELAKMINGEHWHKAGKACNLTIVPVLNYNHTMMYSLPERPSPNLPNDLSVRLYPSLCFFEATSVSVGRGTDFPFQVLGGLNENLGEFEFTPRSIPGVAINPLNKDKKCYGIDLRELEEAPKFTLKYFIDFYHKYENESEFLTRERWLNLLAGTDDLIMQIREGKNEAQILESWQAELEQYKKLRKKYLLYPDFE
ncbi:exo-beta-N-acetylmuramidase NamZ family protein [Maribellus mangrovi]|uniref:exo-beta-N-acetylmuramidase NamZ family protein n=1 Tax=Maribellus mangrovi TaxID=3133146 RepID=UPI0030ECBF2D